MQSDKCEGNVQHFGFKCLSASLELDIYAVVFVNEFQISNSSDSKFLQCFSYPVFLMYFGQRKVKNNCN